MMDTFAPVSRGTPQANDRQEANDSKPSSARPRTTLFASLLGKESMFSISGRLSVDDEQSGALAGQQEETMIELWDEKGNENPQLGIGLLMNTSPEASDTSGITGSTGLLPRDQTGTQLNARPGQQAQGIPTVDRFGTASVIRHTVGQTFHLQTLGTDRVVGDAPSDATTYRAMMFGANVSGVPKIEPEGLILQSLRQGQPEEGARVATTESDSKAVQPAQSELRLHSLPMEVEADNVFVFADQEQMTNQVAEQLTVNRLSQSTHRAIDGRHYLIGPDHTEPEVTVAQSQMVDRVDSNGQQLSSDDTTLQVDAQRIVHGESDYIGQAFDEAHTAQPEPHVKPLGNMTHEVTERGQRFETIDNRDLEPAYDVRPMPADEGNRFDETVRASVRTHTASSHDGVKFIVQSDDVYGDGHGQESVAEQSNFRRPEATAAPGMTTEGHVMQTAESSEAASDVGVHMGTVNEESSEIHSHILPVSYQPTDQAGDQPEQHITRLVSTPIAPEPEPLGEVIRSVAVESIDELQTVRVQLHPRHLGRLEVRVAMDHGGVTAQIVAGVESTRQIIEASLPELRQVLMNQGMAVESLTVSIGSGGHSEPDWSDGNDRSTPWNRRSTKSEVGGVASQLKTTQARRDLGDSAIDVLA